MPTLTLFCGLPGAGTTTLARRLEAQGRGVRLCTDDWQAEIGRGAWDPEAHELLQRALYRHALVLLGHGTDVVFEDGLWTRAGNLADAHALLRMGGHRGSVPRTPRGRSRMVPVPRAHGRTGSDHG